MFFHWKKIHIRNGNAQCALSIVLYDFFMGHEIAFIYSIICMYMLLQSRSKLHDGIEYEKKFKNFIVFFLCFFVYFVMVLFSFFLVVFCLLDTLTQLLFCSISSFQAHCVVLFWPPFIIWSSLIVFSKSILERERK